MVGSTATESPADEPRGSGLVMHEPRAEGGEWVKESDCTNSSSLIVDVNWLVEKNGQVRDRRNNQNPPATLLSGVGSGNSSKPQCLHRR